MNRKSTVPLDRLTIAMKNQASIKCIPDALQFSLGAINEI